MPAAFALRRPSMMPNTTSSSVTFAARYRRCRSVGSQREIGSIDNSRWFASRSTTVIASRTGCATPLTSVVKSARPTIASVSRIISGSTSNGWPEAA